MTLIPSQTAREALKQHGDTMEAARALGLNEADIWNSLPANGHEWRISAESRGAARPLLTGSHKP